MSESFADFAEQMRPHHNSIGICGDGHQLARLIGVQEDALDHYYRLQFMGGETEYWSAVGWFIPLRGVIEDRAYGFLEHVFCLNGCKPASEYTQTKASREENIALYGDRIIERLDADHN